MRVAYDVFSFRLFVSCGRESMRQCRGKAGTREGARRVWRENVRDVHVILGLMGAVRFRGIDR